MSLFARQVHSPSIFGDIRTPKAIGDMGGRGQGGIQLEGLNMRPPASARHGLHLKARERVWNVGDYFDLIDYALLPMETYPDVIALRVAQRFHEVQHGVHQNQGVGSGLGWEALSKTDQPFQGAILIDKHIIIRYFLIVGPVDMDVGPEGRRVWL